MVIFLDTYAIIEIDSGNENYSRYTLEPTKAICTIFKFKIENLKKRFSFADCIGYITALKLNAKFITGDYAFKGFENVEFVR